VKDLEITVKNHPLGAWMIIVLLSILLGTIAGLLFGLDATRSIVEGVRAHNPQDPLEMLHVVFFMYIVLGFCGGAVVGLFAGGVVYVANRPRSAQHLNS
jgi:uncharacterized membrane protein